MPHQNLIIVDYGAQYTQLIARRAREVGVHSIILPHSADIETVKRLKPQGIILSGGPRSVYEDDAPQLNPQLLELDVPVLGICYGLQALTKALGGSVEATDAREYGYAQLTLQSESALLPSGIESTQVWMSHGDHVSKPADGFVVTALSGQLIAVVESAERNIYGLQFHPEVTHTEAGQKIIKKFLFDICNFSGDWTSESYIQETVHGIQQQVGTSNVICALSGGVDSSVAATLVHKAIGDQQTCIFVDTGLLRKNEFQEVLDIYEGLGLNIKAIDAKERFYEKLNGVTDPEQKRKTIGIEFIRIFEEEARRLENVRFLVQGTLYPDVIESKAVHGSSEIIKSHHNVGGLPDDMELELLEPLRELFKDEVRAIGKKLGLARSVTQRQPFPGPGLAVRILGEITPAAIATLQEADLIIREEIMASRELEKPWQYFGVLLPVSTVGVMGDKRTYEQVVAVRAITSEDVMTADVAQLPYSLLKKISSRIVGEVRGVNRVVYDITSKPPGTVEWE